MTDLAEELPYAAVVSDTQLKKVCSYCFKYDSRNLRRCRKCLKLYYCSEVCQHADWRVHKTECKFLKAYEHIVPTSEARLLARLLIRRKNGDSSIVQAFNGRKFDELIHNSEKIASSPIMSEEFRVATFQLMEYVTEKYLLPEEELRKDYGRMKMHMMTITDECHDPIGKGLYLGLSIHGHSCNPDAFIRFIGSKALLRSPKIKEYSTTLTKPLPYDHCGMYSERWRIIDECFSIKCACGDNCSQLAKEGYARSVVCKSCPDGVCLVTGGSALPCISCHSPCPIPIEKVNILNDTIIDLLEENDTDRKMYLLKCMRMFDRREPILSKFNTQLANLGFTIVRHSIAQFETETAPRYAHTFHKAFLLNRPLGCPRLTRDLFISLTAISRLDMHMMPSWVKEVLDQACISVHLSHGPRDDSKPDAERDSLQGILNSVEKKLDKYIGL